jgi:DnaJ-class molecular chaperone
MSLCICPSCKGRGYVIVRHLFPERMERSLCPMCEGSCSINWPPPEEAPCQDITTPAPNSTQAQ